MQNAEELAGSDSDIFDYDSGACVTADCSVWMLEFKRRSASLFHHSKNNSLGDIVAGVQIGHFILPPSIPSRRPTLSSQP